MLELWVRIQCGLFIKSELFKWNHGQKAGRIGVPRLSTQPDPASNRHCGGFVFRAILHLLLFIFLFFIFLCFQDVCGASLNATHIVGALTATVSGFRFVYRLTHSYRFLNLHKVCAQSRSACLGLTGYLAGRPAGRLTDWQTLRYKTLKSCELSVLLFLLSTLTSSRFLRCFVLFYCFVYALFIRQIFVYIFFRYAFFSALRRFACNSWRLLLFFIWPLDSKSKYKYIAGGRNP